VVLVADYAHPIPGADVSFVDRLDEKPGKERHIEIHGRATISVESGADLAVLRTVLESLRK
jgi:hypothetical protein